MGDASHAGILWASTRGSRRTPEERNPYPPRRRNGEEEGLPPRWFRTWWPVVSTVASFILGAFLLYHDARADSTVDPFAAAIYMMLMGYLPIAYFTGLFKR